MSGPWTALWTDETAATAIEYALIAALIAVVIVGALTFVMTEVQSLYDYVVQRMTAVNG
jgi:pilus assembly protein Flp/PilA